LIDAYDIYQILMQYWADAMQDDVYLIVVDGWKADRELIPVELVIQRYFQAEQDAIDTLIEQKDEIGRQMNELEEEICEFEDNNGDIEQESIKLTKAIVKDKIEDSDSDEQIIKLKQYMSFIEHETKVKAEIRKLEKELDAKVDSKYKTISVEEIKTLIVEDIWLAKVTEDINNAVDTVSHNLTARIKELAERYDQPLPEIELEVNVLSHKVEQHLAKMGFTWK